MLVRSFGGAVSVYSRDRPTVWFRLQSVSRCGVVVGATARNETVDIIMLDEVDFSVSKIEY